MFLNSLTFLLLYSFLLGPVHAATKDGVSMPDEITLQGETLKLNGLGIRRATFFNVHVYVGGLYLKAKTQKVDKFLNSSNIKHIKMHFVRDVDRDDIIEGWEEAFENAVPDKRRQKIQKKIDQFNDSMAMMEEGDVIKITFHPKKVTYTIRDEGPFNIRGETFCRALLSVWFINAKDQGLKKGLLGKQ